MSRTLWIGRLALLVAGAAPTLLACELGLRWFTPIGDLFITHNPSVTLVLRPNPAWMPNTVSPTRFTTDELGFRVSHPIRYRAKPPGTFRVFLVGGSTTENMYIDDDRTFGALLERKLDGALRPQGSTAEAINAGRGGTGSADHFYLAWQLVSYAPDVIVYLLGINDMVPYLRTRFQPTATETKAWARSWLGRSQLIRRWHYLYREWTATSRIVRDESGSDLLVDREQSRRAPIRAMPDEVKVPPLSYTNNIRLILSLHRRHQLRAIFLTQPVLWHAEMAPELEALLGTTPGEVPFRYPTGELATLMERYNDVLRTEGAAEPLVRVVDLARMLPKDASTFYDDAHFTDFAQGRIAEILFEALIGSAWRR